MVPGEDGIELELIKACFHKGRYEKDTEGRRPGGICGWYVQNRIGKANPLTTSIISFILLIININKIYFLLYIHSKDHKL
jgi:hypothetical protein